MGSSTMQAVKKTIATTATNQAQNLGFIKTSYFLRCLQTGEHLLFHISGHGPGRLFVCGKVPRMDRIQKMHTHPGRGEEPLSRGEQFPGAGNAQREHRDIGALGNLKGPGLETTQNPFFLPGPFREKKKTYPLVQKLPGPEEKRLRIQ